MVNLTLPSGGAVAFAHDDAGRLSRVVHANGLETRLGFDLPATGRLTGIAHGLDSAGQGGSALKAALGTFTHSYDAKGNLAGVAENGSAPRRCAFQLDLIDRLTRVSDGVTPAEGAELEAYTLDEEGNRLASHASFFHVTDPANRLTEDETHSFEYDVNGNLVRKTDKPSGLTWRYGYTVYDELASASDLSVGPETSGFG